MPTGLRLAGLAAAAAVVPLIVVHVCYGVSAAATLVPLCVPYVDGCTSISAAGRYGTSYFLFKAGMIPTAVLMAAHWYLCRKWLLAAGDVDGAGLRAITLIGSIAAAFLVLYAVFLGSKGDFYNLMRRYGVTVYFSFSYLAQLLLLRRMQVLRRTGLLLAIPRWVLGGHWVVAVALLVIGLGSIPISNFAADKDQLENAFEWNFCLLLTSWYAFTAAAWHSTEFQASFATAR